MSAAAQSSLPELLTPSLRLRAITAADLPALWPITFYNGQPAASLAEAHSMMARIEQDARTGRTRHWAIALAATDEVAGTCGFYRGIVDGVGEIGYVLRPEYRGRGLMTEAVRALCHFGFRTLQLRQIVADTAADNRPSHQVLLRNGFRSIGLVGQWQRYVLLPPQP